MSYITFQPHDYFNTKLYTGNAGTNAITGVGFQPDWLWVKARNRTDSHRLIDVLRGTNTWKTNAFHLKTQKHKEHQCFPTKNQRNQRKTRVFHEQSRET